MNNAFIIAELGVNWRNLFELDIMIRECATCGVDAVKLQAYKPEFKQQKKIFLTDHGVNPQRVMLTDGHPRGDELNSIALTEESLRYAYYRACQHGVELIVTPMYPECITWITPYVKRWKIRYSDRYNTKLIAECTMTGKEVLISSDETITYKSLTNNIKQLYCISEYPPKKGHDLINNYKGFDGASCHYPTIEDALDFVRLGAEILEVHCMRDSYNDDSFEPIDCKVSLRMSELKELVRKIRSEDY
jgi:sialic acid synthase SpsE